MVNLYGYIYNLAAQPVKGATVSVRSLGGPFETLWFPTYTVKTNIDGYFELNLLEESVIDIFIPSIDFRRTLEVPLINTNLFEIP